MDTFKSQHIGAIEVEYVGGDKAKEDCKDVSSQEVTAYIDALRDLVKAVGIAHALGLTPEDF